MNAADPRPDAPTPSDEELFARYRDAHDVDAIEQLVHRYERELYSYLARYMRDPELAKEIFQTTFLRVVQKCQSFEEAKRFRPWLYSIATHAAIDLMRRRGRRPATSLDAQHGSSEGEVGTLAGLVPADTPAPDDEAILDERRRQVRRAVDALPEDLRSVLLLTYFQGLSYQEAADTLEIPLGTVKSRMHTALKRLGLALADDELPLGKSS